jgi:hypothetical protein
LIEVFHHWPLHWLWAEDKAGGDAHGSSSLVYRSIVMKRSTAPLKNLPTAKPAMQAYIDSVDPGS